VVLIDRFPAGFRFRAADRCAAGSIHA
jgi:hypothetical protein